MQTVWPETVPVVLALRRCQSSDGQGIGGQSGQAWCPCALGSSRVTVASPLPTPAANSLRRGAISNGAPHPR